MTLTSLVAWIHYKLVPYTYVSLYNVYIKSNYKTWHCWNYVELTNYWYLLLNLRLTEQFVQQDDNNDLNVPILKVLFCFFSNQVPLRPQTRRNTTPWRRPGGGYSPWTLGGARSVRVWCLTSGVGGSSPTTAWLTAVITSDELNDACHLYTKCSFSIKEINKLLNCLNLSLYYIMAHNITSLHKHWKLQIPHFVFICTCLLFWFISFDLV